MELLRIHLLGNLEIYRGQRRLPDIPTEGAKRLLAAVLLAGDGLLHRYLLSAELWPDLAEVDARASLTAEFWRLREYCSRAGLEPGDYFRSDCNLIGAADRSSYWLDVDQFEQALAATAAVAPEEAAADLIARVVAAVALYRGELLRGCSGCGCLSRRHSLQAGLSRLLEFLMCAAMARGQWRTAIARGQQLLAWDPQRQQIHGRLARCHRALVEGPALIAGHAA